MKIKYELVLSYLILSFLFGAILFVYGFFPLSYANDRRAELKDLPDFIDDVPLNKSVYTAHISRTILMVVDALRSNFIQSNQNASLKYTNKIIIDGSACLFNLHVESPTVTMPRIKAMTTGTIPNFIDVVLNLGSSELNIDSFLHQTYDKGDKIVVCGDNTWVKMFPKMFHRKLENEDSLYVNDFYEGDKNITRELSAELKQTDWKLLILHFLGLDHIGHVEGPFSTKIPSKLKEMDTVIQHIHLAMQEWNKTTANPPLLLVTGDHGMRDTGGHGGSSHAETNVPLIAVGFKCDSDIESHKQIDIAPTLSILLGLPIPASSIGTLIPHLLNELSLEQQLFAYHYNTKRLLNKLVAVEGLDIIRNKEMYTQFRSAESEHKIFINGSDQKTNNIDSVPYKRAKMLYISSAKEMSERLSKIHINYDDFSISLALIVLSTALISILLLNLSYIQNVKMPMKLPLLLAIIGIGCRQIICKECHIESGWCSESNVFYQSIGFAAICSVITINFILLIQLVPHARVKELFVKRQTLPLLCYFLFFGLIFHVASFASSSFIEEEHQTWYYLNSTVFIILYFLETRLLISSNEMNASDATTKKPRIAISLNYHHCSWALLFVGHLLARRLNQTGDKYLSEPDVGDWLTADANRIWNSFFVTGSLCLMYLSCVDFGSILTNVLTLTACMLIYYFRTLNGFVYFAGIKKSESTKTGLILFWLNISEIAAINFAPVLYKYITSQLKRFDIKLCLGTIIVIVALISALTHKPHNIFLIALLLFTCAVINKACLRLFHSTNETIDAFIRCAIHFWIGKQFFFYQGNSNSLASIDVSAGYIGLQSFNFVAVAILLTINTYSASILTTLVCFYNLYDCNDETARKLKTDQEHTLVSDKDSLRKILPIMSILIVFPFAVYSFCLLGFRNHIFVWTVFSPKLLYEFYHLCLMIVLWFAVYFLPKCSFHEFLV